MRTKPNTEQFKINKDPSDFLEGGAADIIDKSVKSQKTETKPKIPPQPEVYAKVHREQKIFRLPLDLINELKREAYERTQKTGLRVTETELVEHALRAFFKR